MNKEFEELKRLVFSSINIKFDFISDEILDRLNKELEVILQLGLAEYFLVTAKIAQICNEKQILRSPGRNYACSSLVNYCLDITKVNPLEYDLIFERFINPACIKIADIDFDIADGRKRELIDELKINLPGYNIYQLLTRPNHVDKYKMYIFFQGFEYAVSPCAIIISKENFKESFIHTSMDGMDYLVINDYRHEIDRLQPFKFDVIESDYLKKLQNVFNLINKENYHPYRLPINDPKTFENIWKQGVDKIDTIMVKYGNDVINSFKPRNIEELASYYTTFREGSNYSVTTEFDNKENNELKYTFSDERVNQLIEKDYGLLIYYETHIQLLNVVAGLDYNTAYCCLKRIVFGRNEERIDEFKSIVSNGCKENSCLSPDEINELMDKIITLVSNSLPKAHSLSYSTMSYWGAFYRTHFPEIFNKVFVE